MKCNWEILNFQPKPIALPLSILLFLFSSLVVRGQLYTQHFEVLQTDKGINYSASFSIDEDPYGYLWIGTIDGLLKYDGRSLIHYRHIPGDTNSLPANRIDLVHCLPDGNILVKATGKPLSFFYRDQSIWIPVRFPIQPVNWIYGMESDARGRTWLTTDKGLYVMNNPDPSSRQIIFESFHSKHKKSEVDSSHVFTSLLASSDDKLWLSRGDALFYLRQDSLYPVRLDQRTEGNKIQDIFEDLQGQLYVLTSGNERIWQLNKAYTQCQHIPVPIPASKGILTGVADPEGNLWISELGIGLHFINPVSGLHKFYSPEEAYASNLGDKYLRKPIRDYAGNIWFPGNTVYKVPATYKRINSFSRSFNNTSAVSAIYPDKDILWIGTLGGGLLSYHFKSGELRQIGNDPAFRPYLPDERVYCIRRLNKDELIVTTRGYLNIYNTAGNSIKSIQVSSGPIRWATIVGDSIWVTHSGPGIFCYKLSTGQLTLYLDGSNGQPVISQSAQIIRDENGLLWLASISDGLVSFNPSTSEVTRYNTENTNGMGINSNTVHVIFIDSRKRFWIGTDAGLNLFDPSDGVFSSITQKDGLTGDLIENIAEDQQGNIWLSAGSGISKYNPATGEIRGFYQGNGMINQQYYPRTSVRDENGLLYFGGFQGMNSFLPAEIGINPIAPKVWIHRIDHRSRKKNEIKAFENISALVLDYRSSYCDIEFAATHFTDPDGNQFAYRIKGLHEEWIQLGNKQHVTLVGLKPGDYKLEVIASNSDGVWSREPGKLSISVPPPFWQTWWFISLAALLLFALAAWIVRMRIRWIRQEEKKQADLREQLAKTEMQSLRSQMNPHFLFNSLNSIKSFIASNEPRMASDYLSKFAMLMRHILNHSKEEVISLQEELDALALYMELEQLRFENKFKFQINVEEGIRPSQVEITPMILQPFVENAIWHGLMHKSAPGHLIIRVKKLNGSLHMEVEDDGVGRSAAHFEKSKTAEKKKSYGMQITSERIRQKYQGLSAIDIIDLVTPDGSPEGTLVKISVPYKMKT